MLLGYEYVVEYSLWYPGEPLYVGSIYPYKSLQVTTVIKFPKGHRMTAVLLVSHVIILVRLLIQACKVPEEIILRSRGKWARNQKVRLLNRQMVGQSAFFTDSFPRWRLSIAFSNTSLSESLVSECTKPDSMRLSVPWWPGKAGPCFMTSINPSNARMSFSVASGRSLKRLMKSPRT